MTDDKKNININSEGGDIAIHSNIDKRSGGIYFEGEGPVYVQGDAISGDQTQTSQETHFHGPGTGQGHAGDGAIDIQPSADQSLSPHAVSKTETTWGPHLARIVVSVVIAAISGIATNIIAAYLQKQFDLLNNQGRLAIVVVVFVITLAIGIWLAVRQGQEPS